MTKTYAQLNDESLKVNLAVRKVGEHRTPVQHEHIQQVALFQWCRLQENVYPELRLLFAIPNGGLRSKITAKKLKAEGAKAGVSDLFLPVPRGHQRGDGLLIAFSGLWIEMKVKPNKPTSEQKEWLREMSEQSYAVCIAYSWEEAKDALLRYLGRHWTHEDNDRVWTLP